MERDTTIDWVVNSCSFA
jgi:hypothetical protein